jgi:hypothetical protein
METMELVLSAVKAGSGAERTSKRWLNVWLDDIVPGVEDPEWGWRRDDGTLREVRLAAVKCAIHASEDVKLDAVTKRVSDAEEVWIRPCTEDQRGDSISFGSPSYAVWY